jgi:hypothetical protein
MSLTFFIDKTGNVVYAQAKAVFETDALEQYVFSYASSTAYLITAQVGSFALTGQTSTLAVARLVTAAAASYSLTAQTATLVWASHVYTLTAQFGSFALTPKTATLAVARLVTASFGSFTLTGKTATLATARLVTAGRASFTLTPKTAGLAVARLVTASAASFTVTAQTAGLLWTAASIAYIITAQPATFGLTGQTAALTYSPFIPVAPPRQTTSGALFVGGNAPAWFLRSLTDAKPAKKRKPVPKPVEKQPARVFKTVPLETIFPHILEVAQDRPSRPMPNLAQVLQAIKVQQRALEAVEAMRRDQTMKDDAAQAWKEREAKELELLLMLDA